MKMDKFLLVLTPVQIAKISIGIAAFVAVLTLTSIAPASAQTNRYSRQSIVASPTITLAAPRTSSCGPYIVGWQEGYPGTARC
jgi:hypothetical protein